MGPRNFKFVSRSSFAFVVVVTAMFIVIVIVVVIIVIVFIIVFCVDAGFLGRFFAIFF